MVTQSDSTLKAIRKKVRRLTASPSTSMLSESDLDEYINTFYSQDFPSSLKIEKLKKVYDVYTQPNIDVYNVPFNTYQAIADPIYVNGRESTLYKDRAQFYRDWPDTDSKAQVATGDGATVLFNFTLSPIPFLRNSFILGTVDTGGNTVQLIDDGAGNVTTAAGEALAGSSVNYVTGAVQITFAVAPESGQAINVSVVPYSASEPYAVLYWQDQLTVRPVPDDVYKISVEAYVTPTEFLATGDSPELNQWWQLIASGAAVRILQDRQDIEGAEIVNTVYEEQRGMALERQAANAIGQRNSTIYTDAPGQGGVYRGWW